jgi:hypothetical protein
MKKNNTLLIIGAAIILYYIMKAKKKPVATPGMVDKSFAEQYKNLDLIKSQTVNFQQVVPTPATIMDLPGKADMNSYTNCGCSHKYNSIARNPNIC